MNSLQWLQLLLIKLCPDHATELEKTILTEDPSQSWKRLCQATDLGSTELFNFLHEQTHIPCATPDRLSKSRVSQIKESIARKYAVIGCGKEGNTLHLACCDPFNEKLAHELAFQMGHKVELFFAPPEEIDNAINLTYALPVESSRSLWISDEELTQAASPDQVIERISLLILDEAVKKNASDIHIQPFLGGGLVRYRVDGQLIRGPSLPKTVQDSVIRFIMTCAHLDTSNHSTPQDGRIQMNINDQAFDLRISILPSHDSQRLVIRLLSQNRKFSMSKLGFPLAEQHALERLCQESRGLILFTGPTGSGKTTSLYTLLSQLNTPNRNIMTAEDPVEYRIPGISQIEVDDKRGRGFGSILKSMLRQDPDIILIGEIRDTETLQITLQAVMTGHLVFATLHTSDVPGTIRRLLDLGASQGQLAEGLKGIIAQRMARQLCDTCAEPLVHHNHLEKLFAEATQENPAMREVGCEACNYTGYKGRFPLIEVFEPSDQHIEALRLDKFLETTQTESQRSMNVIATEAVVSGITSIAEISRVLGAHYWRAFNSLIMQDALNTTQQDQGSSETSLLFIGTDKPIGDEIDTTLPYPLFRAETPEKARELLHQHAGIFAQFIMLREDQEITQQLAEIRKSLAWAGLPTVFIIESIKPEHEQLFNKFKVTRWLSLPLESDQLQQIAAEMIEH
ncbi:GspE/PulE family protein [Neptuniibacter halophilus]|uniref:GspE/PulE family protein n=1 Tax=Neptuniibacter halophilus TaxID=651666 RepID=UPI0025744A73|nr:GspE/PulE family protein [Neptuniibacter halophilus]